jgi:hypothetical protein
MCANDHSLRGMMRGGVVRESATLSAFLSESGAVAGWTSDRRGKYPQSSRLEPEVAAAAGTLIATLSQRYWAGVGHEQGVAK